MPKFYITTLVYCVNDHPHIDLARRAGLRPECYVYTFSLAPLAVGLAARFVLARLLGYIIFLPVRLIKCEGMAWQFWQHPRCLQKDRW